MVRTFKVGIIVALVGSLVFAPAALSDTFRVRATGNQTWSPNFKHIHKGDRIVWKNPTSSPHDITATSDNWSYDKDLPPGEKRAKRFRRRGTYRYKCSIHPDTMRGEIHVAR